MNGHAVNATWSLRVIVGSVAIWAVATWPAFWLRVTSRASSPNNSESDARVNS
jgi:hypothetical protein